MLSWWSGPVRLFAMLLILAGVFTTPARAADGYTPPDVPSLDPNRRIPPVEIVRVDIGFTPESFARGRHAPVRVWLTSGERAFTGTLAIRFPQDSTQHATYLIPATTTPGRVTPHEIAAYIPAEVPWIDVSITDGNAGASFRLSEHPSDDSPPLAPDTQGQLTVLIIGDLEFAHSALKTPIVAAASLAKADGDAPLSLWDNTDAVTLSPDEMFLC